MSLIVEYSPSARANCQSCKSGINKGQIRFGYIVAFYDPPSYGFVHSSCLTPGKVKACLGLAPNGEARLSGFQDLRSADQNLVKTKIEKLQKEAESIAGLRRTAEEISNAAKSKLDNQAKKLQLLEEEVTNHKPLSGLVLNQPLFDKMNKLWEVQKEDEWKLKPGQKMTTQCAPFDAGLDTILAQDHFWTNLPLPTLEDFQPNDPIFEGIEDESKLQFPMSRKFNRGQAKAEFSQYLPDADLATCPYQEVPNYYYPDAKKREYTYIDLLRHSFTTCQKRMYEQAVRDLNNYKKRMDDLQSSLVTKKGFPYLNGMFENPTFLHFITKEYTDSRIGGKPAFTATQAGKEILSHMDFFQICPLRWQRFNVVEEFCEEGKQNGKELTRPNVVKYLYERIMISKKFMNVFRQVGVKIGEYVTSNDREKLFHLFSDLDEDDIALQFIPVS